MLKLIKKYELREGLKNKKNKKYGIFHNRAGGVYPIPHFFIYLFSDSKVKIFSLRVSYSVLPSNQTFDSITFHSIFEQPNNFEYNYMYTFFPDPKCCEMRKKKQHKFVPWMLKKNHK